MPGRPSITPEEFSRPFQGELGQRFPPVLTPRQFADLLNLSVKTIYEWIAKGRLNGACRKRGKHQLIWRDRAVELLFTGKEWK